MRIYSHRDFSFNISSAYDDFLKDLLKIKGQIYSFLLGFSFLRFLNSMFHLMDLLKNYRIKSCPFISTPKWNFDWLGYVVIIFKKEKMWTLCKTWPWSLCGPSWTCVYPAEWEPSILRPDFGPSLRTKCYSGTKFWTQDLGFKSWSLRGTIECLVPWDPLRTLIDPWSCFALGSKMLHSIIMNRRFFSVNNGRLHSCSFSKKMRDCTMYSTIVMFRYSS